MSNVLVVIPTLDRPKMCRCAIESLLRQKFANWSLVIAKNGGAHHTVEYVKALSSPHDMLNDPRLRMLVLPQSGLGYALNEAFSAFAGGYKYFTNLEDDDEWDDQFLVTMVKTLDETGADVAHCLQRQEPDQKQSNGGPMNAAMLKRHNWINFPMCLFRTETIKRAKGFCNEAGPATDWDFHLRALQAGARYEFVPQVLVTHHWHEANYCIVDREKGKEFVTKRLKEGVYG